ncbi:MAG TPA: nitrate- and nitrite sensing domain-containing protein [Rugosimonospora sp.]|nr:nitrate- and nitrite sensing domain-containing protein [Rugosimonospora sp.]
MVRHRQANARQRGGTIGGRLTRILALPVLAVLVLLGVVVVGDVGQYQTATATRNSVTLALSTQDLLQELQEERGLTSGLLGGDVGFKPDLPPSRKKVDAQLTRLTGLAAADLTGAPGVRQGLAQLSGLDAIRAQVDAYKISRADAFTYFTARISALSSVDFGLDRSADATLRRGVNALNALSDSKEFTTQERAFLNGVFSAGGFKAGEFVQFATIHANLLEAEARSNLYATPEQKQRALKLISSGAAAESLEFETRAMQAGDGRLLVVDPQSWWSALTTVLDDMRELQQSLGADIQDRARQLQDDATQRLAILLVIVLACLVGAGILMVVATRAITGPLAKLAAEADALATERLPGAVARVQSAEEGELIGPPDPVRVPRRSSSEILSVAEALERLQGTAYVLATEQAMLRRTTTESLANLGRRNQNLLRRQIGFITKLEQEESDPSGLANLFELDHLATRMRRNAESLLVLVGEASPRRWSAPLPISDVIRAAVSEVEEYRRVTLRRIDDAHVGGLYVTALAHMIAELVENGLAFSPPDVDVEIQGRHLGGQYLIAITDQGIGMEADDLQRANARLRGEENFLMAPTRFLGHYVVGHLARQMDVDVQLSPSPVTGITARVMLPGTLLASTGELDAAGGAPEPMPAELVEAPVSPAPVSLAPASVSIPRQPQPPRAPHPVATHLAIGGRPAPVVEYITVPEVGRPVTVPVPPADMLDPTVRADTSLPDLMLEPEPPAAVYGPTAQLPTIAAPPPAAIPTSPAGPTGPTERTRNGLAKRQPRSRAAEPEPSIVERPARPATLDESPEQMRERLVSLRAGVLRGEVQRDTTNNHHHQGEGERGSRGR